MRVWSKISDAISRHGCCVLVTQIAVEGSAPREPGARMIVMPDGTFTGTIGGGSLEWHVLARAQDMFATGAPLLAFARHALGPGLGQCCGGSVRVMFETWNGARFGEIKALQAAEKAGPFSTQADPRGDVVTRTILTQMQTGPTASVYSDPSGVLIETFGERLTQVLLFGAGHTGRALMLALAPLPFEVMWIDERCEVFPGAVPGNVTTIASRDPAGELGRARPGGFVVAMTHSHARDQAIVHAALADGRFAYVGVIGSQTKRARFLSRLRTGGLSEAALGALICPIGITGITSKAPAAIAASVAAQLVHCDELVKTGRKPVQAGPMAVRIEQAG